MGAFLLVIGGGLASGFIGNSGHLSWAWLGALLNGGIDGKEGWFGIEDLFDSGAKLRPSFPGEVEVRTQIEQSVLADLSADPSGFDKTVSKIGAAGGAGSRLGLPNEHVRGEEHNLEVETTHELKVWHYICFTEKLTHCL